MSIAAVEHYPLSIERLSSPEIFALGKNCLWLDRCPSDAVRVGPGDTSMCFLQNLLDKRRIAHSPIRDFITSNIPDTCHSGAEMKFYGREGANVIFMTSNRDGIAQHIRDLNGISDQPFRHDLMVLRLIAPRNDFSLGSLREAYKTSDKLGVFRLYYTSGE